MHPSFLALPQVQLIPHSYLLSYIISHLHTLPLVTPLSHRLTSPHLHTPFMSPLPRIISPHTTTHAFPSPLPHIHSPHLHTPLTLPSPHLTSQAHTLLTPSQILCAHPCRTLRCHPTMLVCLDQRSLVPPPPPLACPSLPSSRQTLPSTSCCRGGWGPLLLPSI